MIRSFRHRRLKRLYECGDRRRVPADMADKIEDVLAALDAATTVEEMDRPYFRLHPLTGDRKGEWAVTIRANWRITFRFENGDAHDVDFVDYH
ncbi:MAG: type II toxin-antitoxin system RelE/ParE family toxin [Geminicoccaceae bacterium]